MKFERSLSTKKVLKKSLLGTLVFTASCFMFSCSEDETDLTGENLEQSSTFALTAEAGTLVIPTIDEFDVASCTDGGEGSITGTVAAGNIAALFDLEGNLIAPTSPIYSFKGRTDIYGNYTFLDVPNGSYKIVAYVSGIELYDFIWDGTEVETSESILVELECADDSNNSPIVQNDIYNGGVGETVIIDVLANDVDPDGDELSITSVFGGAPHTFEVVGNTIHVTRTARDVGTFIYYSAVDGKGGSDQGSIYIPSLVGAN